jgi:hypothetical protein
MEVSHLRPFTRHSTAVRSASQTDLRSPALMQIACHCRRTLYSPGWFSNREHLLVIHQSVRKRFQKTFLKWRSFRNDEFMKLDLAERAATMGRARHVEHRRERGISAQPGTSKPMSEGQQQEPYQSGGKEHAPPGTTSIGSRSDPAGSRPRFPSTERKQSFRPKVNQRGWRTAAAPRTLPLLLRSSTRSPRFP